MQLTRPGGLVLPARLLGVVPCAVAAVALPATSASAPPLELWTDGASADCSDALTREQVSAARPWCTLQAAALAARAGDTVHVLPGRYVGTVRPAASGSPSAPIRFVAAPGSVTIDAAGAPVGLKLIDVSWLSFDGFGVTGAAGQGVYVDGSSDVTLAQLDAIGNGTYGIQLRATGATISGSTISGNRMGGISELAGSIGNRYEGNTISGNGKDGELYNGDGIQLNGTGATICRNAITENGDPGIYEHGIYAGASSSDYVIEANTLSANAASDIKAAGSNGTVRYNRLGDARLGLVFSDNAQPVSAYYNLIVGRFQHAVFVTTGAAGAQARLWNNTIVQTGRLTSSGDASAVFVSSASLADVRNDLICYTNQDNLGAALWVSETARATLVSNANRLCAPDPQGRVLVVAGVRTTLAAWQSGDGQDGASIASTPPGFDADFRVTSDNLGWDAGAPLGLERDYVGTAVPAGAPDIGAYQRPQ